MALAHVRKEPNPSKRPHNATLLMKIRWLHNFSVSGQNPLSLRQRCKNSQPLSRPGKRLARSLHSRAETSLQFEREA
ncbi:Unknown protein sequence [Pseudomonas savastanoi pv. savastanoi]|nr:Unknown protein sequence [Pseudomonas savastanoi pv. savastanoi]